MDCLLLNTFNLESVLFHIKDLAEIHNDCFVYFLPKMRSENLNQRYFERWNFTVHEDASEVELNLEANVNVGTVDRRRPPKRKASVWNLI